jgi:D-sedoheptulose 7-phosphate isomerase
MPQADIDILRGALHAHEQTFARIAALEEPFVASVTMCRTALKAGARILFCGNGGSAADAQHAAAELTGRFRRERRGLPAIALTTDTSAITAIANDYGFDQIFARQVEALGRAGDVLIAISTSGESLNVLAATERAAALGIRTIALTGRDGGGLAALADVTLLVPATDTARIQEAHIFLLHSLCEAIDEESTP